MTRNLMLASAIAAGLLLATGCSSQRAPTPSSPETLRNVSVLTVTNSKVPDLLEVVGTVRAEQTSVLASQIMGNVVEIRAHEGDRVQRRQVLAVIDDNQSRAAVDRAIAAGNAAQQQVSAAESDLALAESTLKRYQGLFERKSVSAQEFDVVNARYKAALAHRYMARADHSQAKAALSQAQTALDYTRIRAPFDGTLTERKVDAGTLVAPGVPIFTVEDVRRYRLEVSINETDVASVRTGQAVPVLIDALGNSDLKGKVVQIVPAADPGSRSFVVKIELPADPRLRSGLFGRAQFSRGERTSLLIPQTAVVERGQLQGVFVLDQNKVAGLRYVTLGKPVGGNVEVLAGLQLDDRLVSNPGELELDGKRIEAAP